jgi:hypothetical protein
MNHSSYFVCADVIILNDEYVIDFTFIYMYVREWRLTSGGQGTPTCTWSFASIVGVYTSLFCLSAWLSRNSSIITCCCYYRCLCSLLNVCTCVFVERVRKRNYSLIVFVGIKVEREGGMEREEKEKVNALQLW